jgi:predicted metalloprotease
MPSVSKAGQRDERRGTRPWAFALFGALALVVAGTTAPTILRDVGPPSPEPSRTPLPLDQPASALERAALEAFASPLVKDADEVWARDFRRRKKPYSAAQPVLLDTPEKTHCGPGLRLGRSDCAGNNQVFIDLSFQRALEQRFQEEAVAAKAYAIAHEYGHHIQRVLGLDEKLDALLDHKPVASHWAEVQLELQADCLAGVWSRRSQQHHLVEPTLIEAAIRATSELGTERRLLLRSGGESMGEAFTYAIPRRRIYWFAQGYAHGEIDDCDTFAP